jgi:hypothetical protein
MRWLIARVVVTNGEVDIRYVIPTSPTGDAVRFCHLRSDYRNAVPIAEAVRQIPPRRIGAGDPQHRSKEQAVVTARDASAGVVTDDVRRNPLPSPSLNTKRFAKLIYATGSAIAAGKGLSHSLNFDQRRRPNTLRTAMPIAFLWPTSTANRLPRVTPV